MKYLLLILAVLCVNVSAQEATNITQDTVQSNDAINAPTSVMQNTQVNSGVTFDSYGGGVTCARPTFQFGVIGSVGGKSLYNTGTQAYAGINVPLFGGSSCEDAAQAQLFLNQQRKLTLTELMRRDNEKHVKEMLKKDLMYADLLAKVCKNFHPQLVAQKDSTMAIQCASYRVIDHHEPKYDTSEYLRIADH